MFDLGEAYPEAFILHSQTSRPGNDNSNTLQLCGVGQKGVFKLRATQARPFFRRRPKENIEFCRLFLCCTTGFSP